MAEQNSPQDKLLRALELQSSGQIDQATKLFWEVLELRANDAAALFSLGLIALKAGDLDEALRLAERGTEVAGHFAPLWFLKGTALQSRGQKEAALRSYDQALAIQPDYIEVLNNSGALLRDMMRHHEALERFNRILTINPNYASALANCAILLTEFKQSETAIKMFERLLAIDPNYDFGLGLLCFERLHICDWTDYEPLRRQILDGVRSGRRVCKSLAMMAISDSASDQYDAAHTFGKHYCPPSSSTPLWRGERYRHRRIRVAYVSPDLREHPVGHLMAGIIERHDKSRFETIAISLGIDDKSRLRTRFLNAFDQFIDAKLMGARQIAEKMREMEVDIAVDLAGYTSDSRAEIFTYRPAPAQVNYLGYAGTLGVGIMDYIIADRHVIPRNHWQHYSEKVIYLPDAYLPTDSSIQISPRTPSRAEHGLPADGLVFCAFCHDYKINPPMFDIWMRLLQQLPGSVLWLMSRNDASRRNLCREAEARGIDPARLVFAQRVPLVEDHLARYRLADVFLDTYPYNAHTTAADALMAGLPVVTSMGNAFHSRVAGSLLHAIGLPELVATSLAEYEALILRLVTTPGLLERIKEKLRANKATYPLFDTEGFCQQLEAAYIAIWRYSQSPERDALA